MRLYTSCFGRNQNKPTRTVQTVKRLFNSLILRSSLTVFLTLLFTSLSLFSKPISLIITARNSADWSPELISASHEIETLIMSSVGLPSTTIILNPKSGSELKSMLQKMLSPGDAIAKMVIVGHGNETKTGFSLWIGREQINIHDTKNNDGVREIFSPLNNRFAPGAMIHLSGCSLLSHDPNTSNLRIRILRDLFGLKSGSIYANSSYGDDAAYYQSNWSFLKSRRHLISERIFSTAIMAMGMMGFSGAQLDQVLSPDLPLWTKMAAVLTIPTATLIQLIRERWVGYKTHGFVAQFSSEKNATISQTMISERNHFFVRFLMGGKRMSYVPSSNTCYDLF